MRRHNFRGGAATHGSMFHRAPGSIGASSFPSRVVKGMRAAGRMGGDRVTTRNLKVVQIDAENNLLVLRGAVPGAPGGYVMIRKAIAPQAGAEAAGREAVEGGQGQEVGSHADRHRQQQQREGRRARAERRGVRRPREDRSDLVGGRAAERVGAPRHARDQEPRAPSAAAARSRGGRRAPAARASARSATRCGARAAPCSGRSRAATRSTCRRRSAAARWSRRWRRSSATARSRSSTGSESPDRKTKTTAELLKRLGVTGKTLVIDVTPDDGFTRSARNIAGVARRGDRIA